MLLGQVKTHVVSTAKLDGLVGKKLLLVEIDTLGAGGLEATGRHLVCIDTVGAGRGERVLVVMGNSSRIAPDMEEVPTDAVVVGIVDSLQVADRVLVPVAG